MEGGSCDLGHYAKLKYQAKEKFTKEEIQYIFWRIVNLVNELNKNELYF